MNAEVFPKKLLSTATSLLLAGVVTMLAPVSANETTVVSAATVTASQMAATKAWSEATFYQIFVRSFFDGNGDGIGDFAGIEQKLDYLNELGVNALWLTPIHPSPTYHGYSVTDYKAVNPDFGDMAAFKSLLASAHQKDMRVVIDFVANHTSEEHPWFQKMLAGDAQYQDFYRCADSAPDGNWGELAPNLYCFYSFGPQSGLPDLNYDNPAVRTAMKDVADFWIAQGVDGFRLDVAQAIGDGDWAKSVAWWQEFQAHVKAKAPNLFIVGEVNFDAQNGNAQIAPFYQGMNATFDFPLYNELVVTSAGITKDVLSLLNNSRAAYQQVNDQFIDATLIGNHDRARIASELNFAEEKIRKAVALQMTLPGTPFIYYGDEIGMRGGHDLQGDPHKREPMDWYKNGKGKGMVTMDPAQYAASAKNVIAADGISVEEQKADAGSLYNYYRNLISIRKQNPMLVHGNYSRVGTPEGTYGYVVTAKDAKDQLLVVHNQRLKDAQTLAITSAAQELISGIKYAKGDKLEIPAFGSVILKTAANVSPVALGDIPDDALDTSDVTLTVHVTVPDDTPKDARLYMPNSDDGWDPAVIASLDKTTLTKTGEFSYKIDITRPRGSRLEFKFFRGSWENSETDAAGNWTGNRVFLFVDDQADMDVNIQGWRDVDFKG